MSKKCHNSKLYGFINIRWVDPIYIDHYLNDDYYRDSDSLDASNTDKTVLNSPPTDVLDSTKKQDVPDNNVIFHQDHTYALKTSNEVPQSIENHTSATRRSATENENNQL